MRLPFVLQQVGPVEIAKGYAPRHDLERAAKAWWGAAGRTIRASRFGAELDKAIREPRIVGDLYARLTGQERAILDALSRFGTHVPGCLVAADLSARSLTAMQPGLPPPQQQEKRRHDVATGMIANHVLLRSSGDADYWNYNYGLSAYPDLAIPKLLMEMARPVGSVPWPAAPTMICASAGAPRSPAEVIIDLLKVAQALRSLPDWLLMHSGYLSKNSLKKLAKIVPLPSADDDPLALSDPWAFYYDLLHALGFLNLKSQHVRDQKLEAFLTGEPETQAWCLVRAWVLMETWQDSAGLVGPVEYYDRSRQQRHAKELVLWALSRIAASSQDWIDLNDFLVRFHGSTRLQPPNANFRFSPRKSIFTATRAYEQLHIVDQKAFTLWFGTEGAWVASVIMYTFFALGLVECGHVENQPHRHVFRLTPTGRRVLGGPDVNLPDLPREDRFLAVLPNHDVLAYLDEADARSLEMLTRIADCTSPSGKVQTFTIRRDTVCRALDAGQSAATIRAYLEQHGRTPVPQTLTQALTEWAAKRDALVVRSGITVVVVPGGSFTRTNGTLARALSPTCAVQAPLTRGDAVNQFPDWLPIDHAAHTQPTWKVSESGLITADQFDSFSRIRLEQFAESAEIGWQVTKRSIEQALARRLSTDQILGWLDVHLKDDIPPLLQMAIRNWAVPGSVFLGKVHVLKVTNTEACSALISSTTFRALQLEQMSPRWFLVPDEQLPAVKKFLSQFGFGVTTTLQPGEDTSQIEKPNPAKGIGEQARQWQGRPKRR